MKQSAAGTHTLALQVPVGPTSSRALIIAASENPAAIRSFCIELLRDAAAAIDEAADPFTREYYRVQREHLRARLSFVLGEEL